MIPRIRPAVLATPDYDSAELRDEGVLVRIHRNESAVPAPQHVVDAVRALDGNLLRRYPIELQHSFIELLAQRLGTSANCVAIGNGADEILSGLARAFIDPGDNVITTRPTFGMYAHVARAAGAEMRAIPYETRWKLEPSRLIEAADERTRLVILCHPNNPTGDALTAEDVRTIAQALPETLVVVDEVYLTMSDASLLSSSLAYENVAVVASFSKMAALAGMRVGFAVASEPVAGAIRRVIPPFPLGVASLAAADAYLRGGEASRAFDRALAAQITRSLNTIAERIEPYAQSVWRSPGNFILMDFGKPVAEIAAALRKRGVAVRSFSDPILSQSLRFCAADDETTDRLVETVLEELTIRKEPINA